MIGDSPTDLLLPSVLDRLLNEASDDERSSQRIDAIKAAGTTQVYVPTREERLAFKKALMPVHEAMAPRIGKALIEAIYEETGFDPDAL